VHKCSVVLTFVFPLLKNLHFSSSLFLSLSLSGFINTPSELDPPTGLYQCDNVGEDISINLSCEQSDGVISKIDFASYGTSSDVCGRIQEGKCYAVNSSAVVNKCVLVNENVLFHQWFIFLKIHVSFNLTCHHSVIIYHWKLCGSCFSAWNMFFNR